jgi:hypothetical protein
MRAETFSAVLVFVLLPLSAFGGEPPAQTVSFTIDFPGANPSHYEIVVSGDGSGSYTSNGKLEENSDPIEPATLGFVVGDSLRSQIFDLAKSAHYFTGKVDSGRKNIANTGAKTLAYKDASHASKATYNYSMIQPVEQLTSIFQGLSTTLECGRRLTYLHKYEKLALDDELKRMAELEQGNSLIDVQAIAPELKAIADDSSVMNVSRARALRLLTSSQK